MRRRIFIYGSSYVIWLCLLGSIGVAGSRAEEDDPILTPSPNQPQTTDTIRFKNGAVLRGLITRFENNIFTVMIPGTQSRAMVHINDIERIEFAERHPSSVAEVMSVKQPPVPAEEDKSAAAPAQRQELAQSNPEQRTSPPLPMTGQKPATDAGGSAKPPQATPASTGSAQSATNIPPPRTKAATPAPAFREVTVTVPAREVWADSGVDVRRGDRLRVAASGRVNLSRTQSTGPEGINLADPGKMMPNRPTGGLIAVIGDDNDDFIFIGQAAEFVAPRSGRLFLMVNENKVEDNTGSFTVRLQVRSSSGPQ